MLNPANIGSVCCFPIDIRYLNGDIQIYQYESFAGCVKIVQKPYVEHCFLFSIDPTNTIGQSQRDFPSQLGQSDSGVVRNFSELPATNDTINASVHPDLYRQNTRLSSRQIDRQTPAYFTSLTDSDKLQRVRDGDDATRQQALAYSGVHGYPQQVASGYVLGDQPPQLGGRCSMPPRVPSGFMNTSNYAGLPPAGVLPVAGQPAMLQHYHGNWSASMYAPVGASFESLPHGIGLQGMTGGSYASDSCTNQYGDLQLWQQRQMQECHGGSLQHHSGASPTCGLRTGVPLYGPGLDAVQMVIECFSTLKLFEM